MGTENMDMIEEMGVVTATYLRVADLCVPVRQRGAPFSADRMHVWYARFRRE
jgi:hypothetical protein